MTRDRRRVESHRLAGEGVGVREIARRLSVNASTISRDLREPAPTIEPVPGWQDASGYPVAGAESGNKRALTHGAYSLARVEPRAGELEPQVLAAHRHLDRDRDGPAVRRYTIILARIELVLNWLDRQEHAVFADAAEGKAHAIFARLERWERQAAELEAQLALSPLTRTKFGLDQARGRSLVMRMQEGELEGGGA